MVKKTNVLIAFATITLLALLGLQFYYVIKAASIKEEQFNESVSMALCKVADMMCNDMENCSGWESCCMNPEHKGEECNISLNEEQKARMDSLLNYYMEYYHVDLDYSYEVIRTDNSPPMPGESTVFGQKLNPGLPGEYQLRLDFPGKDQFILSEMKGVFISTILLILALIAIFSMTINALIKNNATLKRTTDFVNNMTHELNTPIANIALAVSAIQKPTASDERKVSYASIIKSENERLKLQVERLLDISRLESSGLCLRTETLDLHLILQEITTSFSIAVTKENGQLTSELNAKNSIVHGDRVLLSNVISNLLDNALKYSGGAPVIKITTGNTGNMFELRVTDNGRGIPESEQRLIFEKYYRVSDGDVHDIKGFGLGLTYVRKVVEAHQGSITVDSTPGKGSTFILKLPLSA